MAIDQRHEYIYLRQKLAGQIGNYCPVVKIKATELMAHNLICDITVIKPMSYVICILI
jgi:hypothetical protein